MLEVEKYKLSCSCVQVVKVPKDVFIKVRQKGKAVRNTVSTAGPPAPPVTRNRSLGKTISAICRDNRSAS